MDHLGLRLNNAPADSWRKGVVSWTWRIKVLMHLETELMGTVRERAEDEAINVFARNLHDLLMAALPDCVQRWASIRVCVLG